MLHKTAIIAALVLASVAARWATAYTPESPEVRKLIEAGLKALESMEEERLGGQCLIALAFIKDDKPDHPWVQRALAACRKSAQERKTEEMYSNGLALIFLCEQDATKNKQLIDYYLGMLARRQKGHGGWGYDAYDTGDTSQTQYGALALWEAHAKGVNINPVMAQKAANWLLATQDPSGAWGYQGRLAQGGKLVEQDEITCSMVSAGLGSLFIFADLFGILERGANLKEGEELPEGVAVAQDPNSNRAPRLPSSGVNAQQVLASLNRGDQWMEKNYEVEIERFTSYYMYALERYKSFQELLDGRAIEEPKWYNNGVEYAIRSQKSPGVWNTGCGEGPDTAFTVLFLLRSTQKMIRQSLGEGLSIGGVGLPAAGDIKFRNGKLVAEVPKTEVDDMLSMLDDDKIDALDAMAQDPSALVLDAGDAKSIRKLEQVARTGPWQARIVAVKALSRTGDLDRVPTLLYALTDPQPEVVLAARDGLRFLSRRFDDFGPPNGFTREQQYDALNKWKLWYKSVRPDAPLVIE